MTLEEHNEKMQDLAIRLNSAPTLMEACEQWGVENGGEFPVNSGLCASVVDGNFQSTQRSEYRLMCAAFNSDVIEFQNWDGDFEKLFSEFANAERDVLNEFAHSDSHKPGEFQPQTHWWDSRWRWVCEENEITPDNKNKYKGYFRCVWRIAAKPILK
jgi:hypothetical protein